MTDIYESDTVFGGVSPFSSEGSEGTAPKPRPDILFGEIALADDSITPEQLTEALDHQDNGGDPLPIGEILLDKGYIDAKALRRILEKQARRLSESSAATLETLEEALYGKKVLHLGLATEAEVNSALREQGKRRSAGESARLGQILVDSGPRHPGWAGFPPPARLDKKPGRSAPHAPCGSTR